MTATSTFLRTSGLVDLHQAHGSFFVTLSGTSQVVGSAWGPAADGTGNWFAWRDVATPVRLENEAAAIDYITAPEPDPDKHNSIDAGCDSCGACMAHDGCADADNPHDEARGDCAICGACGDCVEACARERTATRLGVTL